MKAAIITILAAQLLASRSLAQNPEHQSPAQEVARFVTDRLLYGRENTTKWLRLPNLEVISTSPALKVFAERSFADLCQAAFLSTPGKGAFHVFIGSPQEFSKLDVVKRRGPKFGNGLYYYWCDKDRSLNETLVVFDATNMKSEEYFKKYLFKHMLSVFGVLGGAERLPFSSPLALGNEFTTSLAPLEKLLISFNYKHVPPGSKEGDLPKLLKLYWNK